MLPAELATVISRWLEAAGLSAETVETALDHISEDLDAAGITVAAGPGLDALLARHRAYRTSLAQVGHAIDLAVAESDA